jgi:hypothetical protein
MAFCGFLTLLACGPRTQSAEIELPSNFRGNVTVDLCESGARDTTPIYIDDRGFGTSRLCPQSQSEITFLVRQTGRTLDASQHLQLEKTGDGFGVGAHLYFQIP